MKYMFLSILLGLSSFAQAAETGEWLCARRISIETQGGNSPATQRKLYSIMGKDKASTHFSGVSYFSVVAVNQKVKDFLKTTKVNSRVCVQGDIAAIESPSGAKLMTVWDIKLDTSKPAADEPSIDENENPY